MQQSAKEMVTPEDFIHRSEKVNIYYVVKVLLKRFHLKGNTVVFHSQI